MDKEGRQHVIPPKSLRPNACMVPTMALLPPPYPLSPHIIRTLVVKKKKAREKHHLCGPTSCMSPMVQQQLDVHSYEQICMSPTYSVRPNCMYKDFSICVPVKKKQKVMVQVFDVSFLEPISLKAFLIRNWACWKFVTRIVQILICMMQEIGISNHMKKNQIRELPKFHHFKRGGIEHLEFYFGVSI